MDRGRPNIRPVPDTDSDAAVATFDLLRRWKRFVAVQGMADGTSRSYGHYLLSFVWHTTWDPIHTVFGALDFVFGTVYTSFFALLLCQYREDKTCLCVLCPFIDPCELIFPGFKDALNSEVDIVGIDIIFVFLVPVTD